jgi:glycosyltransferase involved in cell wall biosynthesis
MHGFFDLYSLYCVVKATKAIQADILHGHMTRGSHYAGWTARLTGKPAIATAHLTDSHRHFEAARKIIAVSNAVRDYLLSYYAATQIEVIHNGVPVPDTVGIDRQTIRLQLGLAEGQIGLCMVARFIREKGQDLAVAALAQLQDANLRLFLIGKTEGDWFNEVRCQIVAAGLEQQVICLGQREDVTELLVGMDIFLAPSRREALPLAILEACAAGLPVIASRVGGIPEIISHDENGLLFASEEIEALAQAIWRLADDAAKRQALAEKAKATLQAHFGVAKMIQSTIQIYRDAQH